MNLGDARRRFGKPTRIYDHLGICEVHWKQIRTVMQFAGCARSAPFVRFVASGPAVGKRTVNPLGSGAARRVVLAIAGRLF
jgi:hypothetical protein